MTAINKPNKPMEEDERGLLRRAMDTSMSADVHERIKHKLLFAFADQCRTKSGFEQYQVHQVPLANQLIYKPMIPIIIAIVILFSGIGTAVAADQAKPGDALYGVDKALEQTQLDFTFGDTAKAKLLVDIAVEREHEQQELQQENKTSEAAQAQEDANKALQNATQVIDEVQAKQEAKNNGQASESLTKVEEKLNELQQRFAEREREKAEKKLEQQVGSVDLEVTIRNSQAIIKLEVGDQKFNYTLDTTNIDEIVSSIQQRTGLSADDIKAVLKIEQSSGNEDENKDTNSNRSQDDESENRANVNRNTNSSSDDSQKNVNENTNTNSRPDDSQEKVNRSTNGEDQPATNTNREGDIINQPENEND